MNVDMLIHINIGVVTSVRQKGEPCSEQPVFHICWPALGARWVFFGAVEALTPESQQDSHGAGCQWLLLKQGTEPEFFTGKARKPKQARLPALADVSNPARSSKIRVQAPFLSLSQATFEHW